MLKEFFLVEYKDAGLFVVYNDGSLSVERVNVSEDDYQYDESTIEQGIRDTFKTLDTLVLDSNDVLINKVQSHRKINDLCKINHRGACNVKIDNALVYVGQLPTDRILQVSEDEGKYAIIKNPKFEILGFNIEGFDIDKMQLPVSTPETFHSKPEITLEEKRAVLSTDAFLELPEELRAEIIKILG